MAIQNAPSEDFDQLAQAGVNLRWSIFPKVRFPTLRLVVTVTIENVPSECSDQHTNSRSLIRIFTGHILDSQGCNFLHADNETMIRLPLSLSLSLSLSVCLSVCLSRFVTLRTTRPIFNPTKKHAKINNSTGSKLTFSSYFSQKTGLTFHANCLHWNLASHKIVVEA